MILKIIKNEGTKDEKSINIIITSIITIGKLIDVLYPSPASIRSESKGYLTLVNFLMND